MGTWTNDGLTRYYGTDKTKLNPVGEFRYDGPVRCIEIKFDSTQLPLIADNAVVIKHNTVLPIGAAIERVEVYTSTDFDSADDGETLNVGTIDVDGTSNGSGTSIVNAITQTELNTGGSNVAGWVGSLVNGAPLTSPKKLTWEVNTTQPTQGEAMIRIFYSVP